jgi:hypothetical protein
VFVASDDPAALRDVEFTKYSANYIIRSLPACKLNNEEHAK